MESAPLTALGLSPDHQARLLRYRFDAHSFLRLREALARGSFPAERNQVSEEIKQPLAADIASWPEPESARGRHLAQLGEKAIARGEVGVAILNGGMATRFGGVVKGVVEVVDHQSFLALKLADVARAPGKVPVFLLNSFATEADTAAHLAQHNHCGLPQEDIHLLCQSVSVRLTPTGDLFVGNDGQPSFFAPGHGDLLAAMAEAAAFVDFTARGGRYLAVSNVDNLAATLSPVVIGAHIEAGRAATVEVAPRLAGDAGGAPVRRNGRLEVLEGFRFPPGFNPEDLPVFNTNTFVFNTEAIRGDYPLTWFRADKKVDGQPAVQFERLVGEVTSFIDAAYLQVPRSGNQCRFLPVKAPADLQKITSWVRENLIAMPAESLAKKVVHTHDKHL